MQGHLQRPCGNDTRQHGQRDLPGRAGKLHHQGDFRELAGKSDHLYADGRALKGAVGKLQSQYPAIGPGADDTQRTRHDARRQVHFAASGPAPVLFPQI